MKGTRKRQVLAYITSVILLFLQTGCGMSEIPTSKEQSKQAFEIIQMEVDAVEAPIGIDNQTPAFSWKLLSDEPEFAQKSYKIKVYEKDKLTKESKLVWDSGKVKTRQTSAILYDGKELKEHSAYTWTVEVTDAFGNHVCSKEEGFTTAFWKENAFSKSSFISMNPEENVYDDGQAIVRKRFVAKDKEIKEAVLYASALGMYDGYINGERIGRMNPVTKERSYDELKPGWTDYEDRLLYNTYDVTDYLIENKENVMAFMLGTGWWCGRVSQGTYGYHLPAFIGELHILYEDGSKEIIGTDESWEYRKDTAVISADIYNGEVYDGRRITLEQESIAAEDGIVSENSMDSEDGIASENSIVKEARKPVYMPVGQVLGFTGEFQAFYGYPVQELKEYDRTWESVSRYEKAVSDNSTYGHIQTMPIVYEENQKSIILKKGETLIFDFGQNLTGVPYIKYQGKQGMKITLHFGEMLNDSGEEERGNDGPKGSLYQANYRSASSEVTIISGSKEIEEYQTVFSYFGFRYISVTATEDMKILDMKALVVGNTSKESGAIKTDNEKLNRLIENITWSQRNNFLLVATDCPQRDERLGWMGDLQVFQKSSMFNQDLRNFYRLILTDIRDSQREDGSYTDTVPYSIVTGSGNAGWADGGISITYYLYKQYGDITYIEEMYDSMCKYMDYLEGISNLKQGSGRVGPKTAFGDWLAFEETDREYVSVTYYAEDARMMMEMAKALGKRADTRKYKKLHNKIKTYFNKTYVMENELTVQTQTAYLLALSHQLVEGKTKENAIKNLVNDINKHDNKLTTGFLGTPKLLPVLAKEGYTELAYELLLCEDNPSWLYSVNQGATTIWERWDSYTKEEGFHKDGMNSFNHFNNGSVEEFLYESMLGISIDAREGTIIINPNITVGEQVNIKSCEGYYDSIYGKIQVKWSITENVLSYQVTIPANGEGKLLLKVGNEKIEETLKAGVHQYQIVGE